MNLFLTFITLLSISNFANAKSSIKEIKEVSLTEVFVPPIGYDDNDNIEIVIDGKLPSPCYDLHSTSVDRIEEKIYIKQFIRKKNISECLNDQSSNHLLFPVHFSNTISLGELDHGTYHLDYKSLNNNHKTFIVSKSQHRSIDNFLYAPVSSVFIPELIYETSNAQVVLTGIFENTCMVLEEQNIEIKKLDNIFIILPKLSLLNRNCVNTKRPLQNIIDLGTVRPGRYLIHVRSITGRSVNKAFTVVNNPADYLGY